MLGELKLCVQLSVSILYYSYKCKGSVVIFGFRDCMQFFEHLHIIADGTPVLI